MRGPLARRDLPGLYTRICALLDVHRAVVVDCDVAQIASDAVAVEALARMQLGAKRHGGVVRLVNASEDLRDLVAFVGLEDVLPG